MLQESDFQLRDYEFSDLQEAIADLDGEFVDVESDSTWANDEETLVFKVSLDSKPEDYIASLTVEIANAHPDECDCQYVETADGDEVLVFRLRWD